MRFPGHRPLAYLGVFLLCAATLALAMLMPHVLSVRMGHSLMYMVVPAALLGLGAGGSSIALRSPGRLRRENADGKIGSYAFAAGLATSVCALMMTRVTFDPKQMAGEPLHLISLALICCILSVPFFCAGLAISSAISSYRQHIGAVCFAGLLGAGGIALVMPWCLAAYREDQLIAGFSLLLASAAACFWLSQTIGGASMRGGAQALFALVLVGLGLLSGVANPRIIVGPMSPESPTADAGLAVLRARGIAEPGVMTVSVRRGDATRIPPTHSDGRRDAREAGARAQRFDLIQLNGVDTPGTLRPEGSAPSASHLYTEEAVADFLAATTDGGLVSYSRLVFLTRETLRLAAPAVAALEEKGHADAYRHVVVLQDDRLPLRWATLVISNQPLSEGDLAATRTFCQEAGFTVLFDPTTSNQNVFDDCLRRAAASRTDFFAAYPYDVRPVTDASPFFFDHFEWSRLWTAATLGSLLAREILPVDLLALLIAMAQTVLFGALFILRPLASFERGLVDRTTVGPLVYFSALGAGFVALQIALTHKLALFAGHSAYGLTLVVPATLIAAGFGALTVRPHTKPLRRLSWLFVVTPLLIVGTWWFVTFGTDNFLAQSVNVRTAIAIATVTPVAFALGMALPCGIRLVDQHRPELVPWTFAVSALASVFGATATIVLAMQTSFPTVLLTVAGLCTLGFFFLRATYQPDPDHAAADIVQLDDLH